LAEQPLEATSCSPEEEFWSIYEYLIRCAAKVEQIYRQNGSYATTHCTVASWANECLTATVPSCYDNAYNERWGHISSQLLAYTKVALDVNGMNQFWQCSVEQLGALWRLAEVQSTPGTAEDMQAAIQEVSVLKVE